MSKNKGFSLKANCYKGFSHFGVRCPEGNGGPEASGGRPGLLGPVCPYVTYVMYVTYATFVMYVTSMLGLLCVLQYVCYVY